MHTIKSSQATLKVHNITKALCTDQQTIKFVSWMSRLSIVGLTLTDCVYYSAVPFTHPIVREEIEVQQ